MRPPGPPDIPRLAPLITSATTTHRSAVLKAAHRTTRWDDPPDTTRLAPLAAFATTTEGNAVPPAAHLAHTRPGRAEAGGGQCRLTIV